MSVFCSCRALKKVILNEGLRKIGERAFQACASLERIEVPSTVREIDGEVFSHCRSLSTVVLNEGLKIIGDGLFVNCGSLQHIEIPSTVRVIPSYAFCVCCALRDVILNENLKKIGYNAFCECASLESIQLPSSVDAIGRNAFEGCNSLRFILLDEAPKTISRGSFSECIQHLRQPIPNTYTEIVESSFEGCHLLEKIVCNGPLIFKHAFNGCSSLEGFKYPSLSMRFEAIHSDAYRTTILNKIHETPDILLVEGELIISSTALGGDAHGWPACRKSLGQIVGMISYYELELKVSIFELALWKAKTEESNMVNDAKREMYRPEVPGPIREAVLQFCAYHGTE